jgi:hypothetical protein
MPTQLTDVGFPVNLEIFRLKPSKSRVRGLLLSMLYILRQEPREGRRVILITSNELQDAHIDWLKRASNTYAIFICRPSPDELLEAPHYNSSNTDVLLSTLPLSYSYIQNIFAETAYVVTTGTEPNLEPVAKSFFIPYTASVFSQVIGNKQIYSVATSDFIEESVSRQRDWTLSEVLVLSGITRDLRTELTTLTETLPPDALMQRQIIYNLGLGCLHRKFELIKAMLIHPNFEIRDDMYRHRFCSSLAPNLVMNDSAFLLRCGVAGGSSAIVNILLHETGPGSQLDPSAMDNLGLRDAILGNKSDIIQLIASDPRLVCASVYYEPRKYRLDELPLDILLSGEDFSGELNPDSLEIYTMNVFQEFFKLGESELKLQVKELGLFHKVRDSHLHRVLLLALRQAYNASDIREKEQSKKLADLLCLASSMRERRLKELWLE